MNDATFEDIRAQFLGDRKPLPMLGSSIQLSAEDATRLYELARSMEKQINFLLDCLYAEPTFSWNNEKERELRIKLMNEASFYTRIRIAILENQ